LLIQKYRRVHIVKGSIIVNKYEQHCFGSGAPVVLDADELLGQLRSASVLLHDEAAHSRPLVEPVDPSWRPSRGISDEDIRVLKQKHSFLAEFSDSFIRSTPVGDLMKIESTAMKAKEIERAKDADYKLAQHKSALASTFTEVRAGQDNRWTHIHQARFLGGASCLAAKLWLAAREAWGSSHPPALGNYDMGAVGLAGYVSAAGWVNIHNPASLKLSIRQFNINNCSAKSSGKKGQEADEDILELGEFKLAVRAMRTAMEFFYNGPGGILPTEQFLCSGLGPRGQEGLGAHQVYRLHFTAERRQVA
jgi:hypothetical protein